jgi:prepilin-type N-terminal cleavage/methylation domain-containing protein
MDQRDPSPRSLHAALRAQAGMTLLEIMIVLVIIALVMGVLIGPALMRKFGESKVKAAHVVTKKFAYEAYSQWSMANPSKGCPDDLKSLTKYMNSDDTKDPFGEDYVMVCGDGASELPAGTPFGVMSKGQDKKAGTPDDIQSWAANAPSD